MANLKPFRIKYRIFNIIFGMAYFFTTAILVTHILRPHLAADATSPLIIPEINLSTPVSTIYQGHKTLVAPDYIPGAYFANHNKIFIIGHLSTIFKDLHKMKPGTILEFDSEKYQAVKIEILEKSAIDMKTLLKSESDPTIILMTCYGTPLGNQDYTHRLIVYASKLKS